MKITVDARAAMKSAAEYVLNDLECLPVELELTDDPNDLLKTVSNIANEYRDEFVRCLEIEFNARLSQVSSQQLTDNGIHIVRKEDS